MVRTAAEAPLLERTLANYGELFRAMARTRPDGAILEEQGLLLVRSGVALPFFNLVLLNRVPPDLGQVLERAREFYAPFDLHWALGAQGAVAEAIAPRLVEFGMYGSREPGMLLAPLDGVRPSVDGLDILVVRDLDSLRRYNDTMTEGFGGGPWATPEALTHELLSIPDVTHYLGLIDGVPVATAARISSHRIAGVVNVSTRPDYRRRGIGAAMTWRAALDGRDEGCIASYLHASKSGLPVYLRMGYRRITTFHTWHAAREA